MEHRINKDDAGHGSPHFDLVQSYLLLKEAEVLNFMDSPMLHFGGNDNADVEESEMSQMNDTCSQPLTPNVKMTTVNRERGKPRGRSKAKAKARKKGCASYWPTTSWIM